MFKYVAAGGASTRLVSRTETTAAYGNHCGICLEGRGFWLADSCKYLEASAHITPCKPEEGFKGSNWAEKMINGVDLRGMRTI